MQPFFYAFYVKSWIAFACISCIGLAKNILKLCERGEEKYGI